MDKKKLSKKAYLLHLSSLSLADGIRQGKFRSLFHGQGIEFRGVRDYLPGDDIRAIDWNVTARMAKPYVKVFEEDRDLDVFIIVDKSLSMETGSRIKSRLDIATECASLIALASYQNSSPVGAVTFDGKIEFSCAPKAGKDHLMLLLSEFEKNNSKKLQGSSLETALAGAIKLLRKRTLVIVISDFRAAGWTDAFAQLCTKNDVVAIRVTDPTDDELPSVGSILFTDPETDYSVVLPSSSRDFARAWKSDNIRRVDIWKKECLRHGGYPLCVSTDDDPARTLVRFFTAREKY
ncbi:DUF58 domain-containing protein [Treponema sp.]|uniref:DUF58 domain-containing protein n=1 Tax=Treponema sp. TaxID=166 RepID=UPI0025FEB53C|nr:DUF58 domain-containing protein [Treponema sp.]MCR5219074.1 DUF58 domain-containing protein [Treponema sp.]